MGKKAKFDHYVYSTLTTDMKYTGYHAGGAEVPTVAHEIFIAGGSNVADGHFDTPHGVVTGVTNEQLEQLMANDVFRLHMENGFITVSDSLEDEEVMAADMTGADKSAPLTPNDFETDKEPKVNDKSRKA